MARSVADLALMMSVIAGPDVTTPLGVRDRAILEVLYSTAIRRAELIALKVWDVDHDRGTVFVRQGKGARDRQRPDRAAGTLVGRPLLRACPPPTCRR